MSSEIDFLQDENNYAYKKISTPGIKFGLRPHDSNRTNLISNPADHLDPSPFHVAKPLKVSFPSPNNVENIIPLNKKVGFAVRFQEMDKPAEEPQLLDTTYNFQEAASVMYSPQTPGFPARKIKAGSTPFKGDMSVASVALQQDSFMIAKFGHDYGVHKDYDHDYSLLNKTSSTLTSSIPSSTPDVSQRVNAPFISQRASTPFVSQRDSLSPEPQSSPDSLLQDLLQFPSGSPPQANELSSVRSLSGNQNSHTLESDKSHMSESPIDTTSPLSSISQQQSAASDKSYSTQNGLTASFLLREDDETFTTKTLSQHFSEMKISKESSPLPGSEYINFSTPYAAPSEGMFNSRASIQSDILNGSVTLPTKMATTSVGSSRPLIQSNVSAKNQSKFVHTTEKFTTAITNDAELNIPERKINEELFSFGGMSPAPQSNTKSFHKEPEASMNASNPNLGNISGECSSINETKIKDFDLDFFKSLKSGYMQGKISKSKAIDLMNIFYELQESDECNIIGNKENSVNFDVRDSSPVNDIADRKNKSIVSKSLDSSSITQLSRSSSAPRNMKKKTTPNLSVGIRDDSVESFKAASLIKRRKETMDDLALSPRQSPTRDIQRANSSKIVEANLNSARSFMTAKSGNMSAKNTNEVFKGDDSSGYMPDGTICNLDSSFDTTSSISSIYSNQNRVSTVQSNRITQPISTQKVEDSRPQVSTVTNLHSAHKPDTPKPIACCDPIETSPAVIAQPKAVIERPMIVSPGFSLNRPSLSKFGKRGYQNETFKEVQVEQLRPQSRTGKTNTDSKLNQSDISLPFLGNNEPSFARRVGGSYNFMNHKILDSPPATPDKNGNTSSKLCVDVSIQCPSVLCDSPESINALAPSTALSPTQSSIVSNNYSKTDMYSYDDDSHYLREEYAKRLEVESKTDLTGVWQNLQDTILRHNLNIPWPRAAPTPASQAKSSRKLHITSAMRVPIQSNDDTMSDIQSMENALNSNERCDDDTLSLSSSIVSSVSSTYDVPSVIQEIIKEKSSASKNRPYQSLSHTINNKPFFSSPVPNTEHIPIDNDKKPSFDVTAISLDANRKTPTPVLMTSRLSNSSAKRVPISHNLNDTTFDESLNESLHENQEEYSHNEADSGVFSMATTMTFESACRDDFEECDARDSNAPKLVIASKRRSKKTLPESMKEINLVAKPGGYTTVVLTFSNKRSSVMSLYPAIIQTRFDVVGVQKTSAKMDTTGFGLDLLPGLQAFQVSPHKVHIQPGDEATVYVTFTPSLQYEGIYTGALKIKSNKKSFVILLRGEAFMNDDQPKEDYATPMTNNAVVEQSLNTVTNSSKVVSDVTPNTTELLSNQTKSVSVKGINQSASDQSLPQSIELETHVPTNLTNELPSFTANESIGRYTANRFDHLFTTRESSTVSTKNELSTIVPNQVISTPDSINSSALADAVISLNRMADDFMRNANYSSTPKGTNNQTIDEDTPGIVATVATGGLYDFIIRANKESVPPQVEEKLDATELRRKYLKDWISKCKVASKGLTKYPDVIQALPSINNANLNPNTNKSNHQSDLYKQHSSEQSDVDKLSDKSTDNQERDSKENNNQDSNLFASSNASSTTSRLAKRSYGVFFRQEKVQFGSIEVGTLTRVKLELCNATDSEVHVIIGDPNLPFVVLHNSITIRPRSYVRLPVRFVPTTPATYSVDLIAQTEDGSYCTNVKLNGTAF